MISNAKKKADGADRPETTADAFLGGRIEVVQNKAGHRAGSDAVFLAAAVPARSGESVLDAGAGAGTAGLCVLARVPETHVTAVEIDETQCALAKTNAVRNGFEARFRAIAADLTAPSKVLSEAGLIREGYGHVMANPPFYAEGSVRVAPDASRAAAHVMPQGELERWVRFLATMTAPKGTLTLIHRAGELGNVLEALKDRFGDLAIFPLFPKPGTAAGRIIVRGRKNSRAGLRVLPGLVLHEAGGAYTKEAEAILRGGAALSLDAPRD